MLGSSCCDSLVALPLVLLTLCLSLSNLRCTYAQPAQLQYEDCFSSDNTSVKLNISTVYAQVLDDDSGGGKFMNLTVLGETPEMIPAQANTSTGDVATTLFTTTEMLTFEIWNNNTFFCDLLRPATGELANVTGKNYCPLAPGPLAFSSYIPLPTNYELATFDTHLYALDPYQRLLFCINVNTTLLDPGPLNSVYGHAGVIFWVTVSLAIGYWLVVGIARLASAWGRGSTRNGKGVWSRVESAGYILASAISGERLATSPALMRFCTPSLRDIIFHTQWCATLAMVAVKWPGFIYPIMAQTAWSTLVYNITLSQGSTGAHSRWNPLTVPPYDPPAEFSAQLDNASSPIHIVADAPNLIFQLPSDATPGLSSFAWAVGLRPQDLFGMCLTLFLAIIGATILLSVLVWALDWVASLATNGETQPPAALGGSRSPRYSAGSKDLLDGVVQNQSDENRSLNSHLLLRTVAFFPRNRPWLKLRTNFVSYHTNVLQGNLVRILIWFHLPVTIFSCYQMTLGRENASLGSIILAAISFAVLSVLLPIFLVVRLTLTNTTKLYDETWTLLSLGPLYNHYRHGSQLFACLLFATNIAFGVTIGCGQKSGTAQAIIILVVEIVSALGTSIWLPWGQGASMGLISFLFCVARIVIAVLLVILTPAVSVDSGAAQWVAYAILCILALIYLAFFLMLVVKIIEGVTRMCSGIGFHKSRHVVDSGLLGVLGLLGCCGSRRPRSRADLRHVTKQPSAIPLTMPKAAFRTDTPTGSTGPPSVLRPEHALQPYKEDSDDETGFIMGAWQPFPGPGYTPVDDGSRTPELPKTGFARVGGGRAHYESPYAIASGSTQNFPKLDKKSPSSTLAQRPVHLDYSPPPTPSISSVARRADINYLPPGAMPPPHVRTKSQTAIIEDASALAAFRSHLNPTDPEEPVESDDAPPPKKRWFNRRKSRRMSEGDLMTMTDMPISSPQEPGRSFVVVRKQRPGMPSNDASNSSNNSPEPERKSFTVLRGNQSESHATSS
ncbi:uncharacterized protein LAESUDRAFT_813388 [Laetiporus sulphureus 93-53]|uniref:TRP C-terminal domain-containing protein n=1 Tax=Laetiporus sulphureus 93-53 TaxID=1314785 RepID=A0A165DT29_9APHY|nr:uncharacterized protein LAESUDRAFT_813388 [Laetiporus sulphureus 93-53]KZT05573.1 hypothetical protein LAESUDRAFT_813388 [Laetiporus sulphureus 93-53]